MPPAVRLVRLVHERFVEDAGSNLSAAIAYYGFLSMFPLLLLAAATLGFAMSFNGHLAAELISRLSSSVPGLGHTAGESLDALLFRRSATGITGVATLAWTGSSVLVASQVALARIARVEEPAKTFRLRMRALGALPALGGAALAGSALSALAAAAPGSGAVAVLIAAAAVIAGVAADAGMFALAYTVLWPRDSRPVRPGAVSAAVMWTALKVAGGSFGASLVARSSAAYGALGGAIGMLVLLNLGARAFVYGAEVNAVLAERRHAQPAGDLERAALRKAG